MLENNHKKNIKKSKESIFSQLKKCVTFIFIGDEKDLQPRGTGFFVAVNDDKTKEKFGYFVTAKHVIQDEKGEWLSTIFLRLNKRDSTATHYRYKIDPEKIFTHDEPEVDLAVLPFIPDRKIVEFKFLPTAMIATKEKMKEEKIEEGDDVFFTGLFSSFMGVQKNHPIFRFGKVALMTDEKIDWIEERKKPVSTHLFLLECQTFGGNSGSPVFFRISAKLEKGEIPIGPPSTLLAGIVKGSYQNASEVQILDMIPKSISYENVGISAVTPAYKLNEILFHEKAMEHRKNIKTVS